MTTETEDRLIQELRSAFRAAAEQVRPAATPLPVREGTVPRRRSVRRRPRWLIPAAAAAVLVVIGLPLGLIGWLRAPAAPDLSAAARVHRSGELATVAGVTFTVPEGWAVTAEPATGNSISACVTPQDSAKQCLVTVRVAVPDGDGHITPLPDPTQPLSEVCDSLAQSAMAQLVDLNPVDGRPAAQYLVWCGTSTDRLSAWVLSDGSLTVSTPATNHAVAAALVASLGFSSYNHSYGPQRYDYTQGSSAPAS